MRNSSVLALILGCAISGTAAGQAVASGRPRSATPDTLNVARLASAPVMDGRVGDRAYGLPTLQFCTAAGSVRVWLGRHDDFLYIAADLPDSTFYWGDDLVVSIDPAGRGGDSPAAGDRQWYLRRVLDSSVVAVAESGRWYSRGHEPAALGATRHHAEWDVASSSSPKGWMVELRVRTTVIKPGAAAPRLALRTYNDQPAGWWSWPAPPVGMSPQRVERTPALWIPLRLQ
jgi:hypothetical protein